LRIRLLFAALLGSSAPAAAQTFDDHVHLHQGDASLKAYEAQLRGDGVDVAGFGAMWFGGPNQALAGNPEAIRRGNDSIVALGKRDRKLRPIATVHPYDGDEALEELTRVAGLGVRTLKIHPHTQRFDAADPRVLAVARRAGELGIVVLMDNASIVPGDYEKLLNLALAAPRTKFVFAHLGGLNFRAWNVLKLARTAEDLVADNIWFDISATVVLLANSPLAEEFAWTIRNVGVHRVMLGSDYPQFSLKQNLSALQALPLTDAEKARIAGGSAAELFATRP
jgi:predicted TIM-barrel fold metal-dependent hydrolase